jgi:hypothetical protein
MGLSFATTFECAPVTPLAMLATSYSNGVGNTGSRYWHRGYGMG